MLRGQNSYYVKHPPPILPIRPFLSLLPWQHNIYVLAPNREHACRKYIFHAPFFSSEVLAVMWAVANLGLVDCSDQDGSIIKQFASMTFYEAMCSWNTWFHTASMCSFTLHFRVRPRNASLSIQLRIFINRAFLQALKCQKHDKPMPPY